MARGLIKGIIIMSTPDITSTDSLDASATIALGLIGAGLTIGAGRVLKNAERREACVRFMRDLGLPQMGREAAAALLVKIGTSISGSGASRTGRFVNFFTGPSEPIANA